MAATGILRFLIALILIVGCLGRPIVVPPSPAPSSAPRTFVDGVTAIYNFGDSISDTGNFIREGAVGMMARTGGLPYGSAIGGATGRCSDGYLMIDFLAQDLGLPLLSPYLDKGADFTHGVNFAVTGATALDTASLAKMGVSMPHTNSSLSVQLQRFKEFMASTTGSRSEARARLASSLVMVGEIGGNDYNFAFSSGVPREKVRAFVPAVVDKLAAAVEELIGMGARAFMVPGNLPFGCAPLYLRRFARAGGGGGYDARTGCLSWYNRFAEYHNRVLTARLDQLRLLHPDVTIVYADWYGSMMSIFQAPGRLGITNTLLSCCGNQTVPCGKPGCTVCDDPSTYGSWDGTHPTEAVYKVIADGVLHGPHASPLPLAKTCPLTPS